jgi:H+/Cl- antiporter ClcA
VFAIEVLAIGRIQYDALIPCLFASILADITCHAYGIGHVDYASLMSSASSVTSLELPILGRVAIAGVLFGLASYFFAVASHGVERLGARFIPKAWLVPAVGAVLVIGLTYALGTRDYLGLGVTTMDGTGVSIVNAFHEGSTPATAWFWKLVFTAITLGVGFKGGEVTPLFFIGATLGNTIAIFTGAPVELFAALGFIAVFAGATNTPLACTVMGVELFGGEYVLYYAVACYLAYYFSGNSGIYSAQRLAVAKYDRRPVKGQE